MANLIPRLPVSYTPAAFASGCKAVWSHAIPDTSGLDAVFGARELVWTGSGRQALSLMLRAMKLAPGAKVAVPLLSSSAVAGAVAAAGCEPVFVDVDPNTMTMDPNAIARLRSKLAVIVPVHLFGNVAQIEEIIDAAAGVPVIEDTAQAPLSFWRNRLAGTFGLASFYSFASSKCVPAGGGGLAAINQPDLAANVRELAAKLASRGRVDSLRRAAMQMAKAALFSRALYGPVGNRLRAGSEESGFLLASVDTRAIAASSAAAVKSLAAILPARLERQRRNSLALLARIGYPENVVLPVEPAGARYAFTLFPVLLANPAERDAVRRSMLEQGVDTSTVHHNCAEAAAPHGYKGGCPVSESAAGRLLTLPNFAALGDSDLDRVASVFLTSLKRYRTAVRVRTAMEAFA